MAPGGDTPPVGGALSRNKPLTMVPEEDVVDFLEHHYGFAQLHPTLDLDQVAEWICDQHGGAFAATVQLVERLHDTGFQDAYDALAPGSS